MNIKTVAVTAVLTFVLGIGVGFPVGTLNKGVKTVVKTKPVPAKIQNGISTLKLISELGTPAAVTQQATPVTLPSGCAEYTGPKDASGKYKWIAVICPLER